MITFCLRILPCPPPTPPNKDHLPTPTILEEEMEIQRTISPQSHYPCFLPHWPSAKNLSLFTEWWARTSWLDLTASRVMGMSLLVWVPAQNVMEAPSMSELPAEASSWNGARGWEERDSIFLSQYSQIALQGVQVKQLSSYHQMLWNCLAPIYTKHRKTMRNWDVMWNKENRGNEGLREEREVVRRKATNPRTQKLTL